jgi:hypothetical protein
MNWERIDKTTPYAYQGRVDPRTTQHAAAVLLSKHQLRFNAAASRELSKLFAQKMAIFWETEKARLAFRVMPADDDTAFDIRYVSHWKKERQAEVKCIAFVERLEKFLELTRPVKPAGDKKTTVGSGSDRVRLLLQWNEKSQIFEGRVPKK